MLFYSKHYIFWKTKASVIQIMWCVIKNMKEGKKFSHSTVTLYLKPFFLIQNELLSRIFNRGWSQPSTYRRQTILNRCILLIRGATSQNHQLRSQN